MKIQQFLEHHGLVSNPFADEDAQTDLVFKGACIRSVFHPAWDKIYGDPTEPATSRRLRREGLRQDGHAVAGRAAAGRLQRRSSRPPGLRRAVRRLQPVHRPFPRGFSRPLAADRSGPGPMAAVGPHRRHPLAGRDATGRIASWRCSRPAIRPPATSRCRSTSSTPTRPATWPCWRRSTINRRPRTRPFAGSGCGRSCASPPGSRNGTWPSASSSPWRPWGCSSISAGRTSAPSGAGCSLVIAAGWLPWLGRFLKYTWKAWQIGRNTRVLNHSIRPLRKILLNFPAAQLVGQPLPVAQQTDHRYQLLDKLQSALAVAAVRRHHRDCRSRRRAVLDQRFQPT